MLEMTKVAPNIQVPAIPAISTKYTRKSKLNIRRNQDPPGIVLFERGVQRRVALIVHRDDRENLVPGTNLTMDELQRYQLAGRRLQARAVASVLTGLLRAVVRPVKKLAAVYARGRRQVAAIRQLGALDNLLLQDVGIRRENIPEVVAGLMSRPPATHAAAAPVAPPAAGQPPACNDGQAKSAA
jgi:uncharacterized protein YjiS (DUF1127 family)